MYLFVAHYTNIDDYTEITRKIEIEEQFFNNERDIYLYAMGKAYDMMQDNEGFDNLEFISC
jgi:hypothetical protein